MKALITLLASLMIVNTCIAARAQQTQWRLEDQQARLKAIDEQIAAERKCIDKWHARQLADLQVAAEREAGMLLAAERILMTDMTTPNCDAPVLVSMMGSYFPRTLAIAYNRGLMTTNEYRASLKLFDAARDRYYLEKTQALLLNKNFRAALMRIINGTNVRDAGDYLLRGEARRLIAVMDRLDREAQYIEKVRARKLAGLEEKVDRLKDNILRVMGEIRALPAAQPLGKVTAICMAPTGSFCMIDGVNGLVANGAKIGDNVTVVEISEQKVKFRKAGATWEQKVGRAPAAQWK